LIALIGGCESTSSTAPAISPAIVDAAAKRHVGAAQLAQGRTLYTTRCIACHTVPTIAEHSADQWPRILDEMAKRSGLSVAERDAVLAYVLAARAQP
jgi:mono/diheme cytochrome c family protein